MRWTEWSAWRTHNVDSDWRPAEADLSAPEVGTVWDLCLAAEYDREQLVRGLAEWLGPPGEQRVLDCACGSGFPSLDLHRLGYNLTCTDASPLMLERFRHNAQAAGIDLEPQQARWEDLDTLFLAAFDVVLCRGCSLIYAGTWDTEAEPDRSAFERSVQSLARCLRPGGRLYVDTTQEEELRREDPQLTEHPLRMIDGHRVELHERVTTDRPGGVRRWRVWLRVDDTPFDFERMSHYMPHDDLAKMLRETGLEEVGRAAVSGEPYAVFVGQRPIG
jgi:SAM-dependent methyltransferase